MAAQYGALAIAKNCSTARQNCDTILTLPFLLLYIWSDKTSAKIFGWFWLVTYVVLLPMFGMFTGFYRVK